VLKLLDSVIDRGAGVMANRVLATIKPLFSFAIDRGLIEVSPCDRVKPPAVEKSRDRVLSDDELRVVWLAAEEQGWPFGTLVQLLILTGARRDELAGASWREFDRDERLWTLPRHRAKNDREHPLPLADQAMRILDGLPHIAGKAELVFTTNGASSITGWSRSKRRLDGLVLAVMQREAAGRGEDLNRVVQLPQWTRHDLRRTVASGMARLGVSLPVIERVLNHVSGSFAGIVGVYQRHSFAAEMRAALEVWGRHVETLCTGPAAGNVVVELKRTGLKR
jgi:integrase